MQYVLVWCVSRRIDGNDRAHVLPSTALTAEWQEVENMAIFHLAMRANCFDVAALHRGKALDGS